MKFDAQVFYDNFKKKILLSFYVKFVIEKQNNFLIFFQNEVLRREMVDIKNSNEIIKKICFSSGGIE